MPLWSDPVPLGENASGLHLNCVQPARYCTSFKVPYINDGNMKHKSQKLEFNFGLKAPVFGRLLSSYTETKGVLFVTT